MSKRSFENATDLSQKRLRTMWKDRVFTDASVACGGETWPVHRALMAVVSPVFNRMLTSEFQEGQVQRIEIQKAEPRHVSILLDFLYTADPTFCIVEKILQVSNVGDRSGSYNLLEGETVNRERFCAMASDSQQEQHNYSWQASACTFCAFAGFPVDSIDFGFGRPLLDRRLGAALCEVPSRRWPSA